MENIKKGFIATRFGLPTFIYDQNVACPFTDESLEMARSMNGDKVECTVEAYFPDGAIKAKLVDQHVKTKFPRLQTIAWEIYKAVRSEPNSSFKKIWHSLHEKKIII